MPIQFAFNASTVKPSEGPEAVPAGWYNAMMDESDLKDTSDGQGKFLVFRFNILDGQYAGRKLFARLNVRNNNAQTQEIAYRDLSALCHAVGVIDMQSTGQLHGIPLKLKASYRAATPKKDAVGNPTGELYEPSNDIKAYKNINHVVDMATATAPAGYAQPAQAPAGFGTGMPQVAQAPQHNWNAPAPQQAPQQQAPQYAQPPVQPTQYAQPPVQQPQQYAQPAAQQPQQGAPMVAPAQQAPQQPWGAQPQQQAPVQQQPMMQQAPVAQAPVATNPSQPWPGAGAAPQQAPQAGASMAPPWAAQGPSA